MNRRYMLKLLKRRSLPMNHPTFAFLVDGLPNIGLVLYKLPLESLQLQFFVHLLTGETKCDSSKIS